MRAAGSESRNLDHGGRVSRAREVRYIRRLGIKAARRKFLEFLFVEVFSVTEVPQSPDYRYDPVMLGVNAGRLHAKRATHQKQRRNFWCVIQAASKAHCSRAAEMQDIEQSARVHP